MLPGVELARRRRVHYHGDVVGVGPGEHQHKLGPAASHATIGIVGPALAARNRLQEKLRGAASPSSSSSSSRKFVLNLTIFGRSAGSRTRSVRSWPRRSRIWKVPDDKDLQTLEVLRKENAELHSTLVKAKEEYEASLRNMEESRVNVEKEMEQSLAEKEQEVDALRVCQKTQTETVEILRSQLEERVEEQIAVDRFIFGPLGLKDSAGTYLSRAERVKSAGTLLQDSIQILREAGDAVELSEALTAPPLEMTEVAGSH